MNATPTVVLIGGCARSGTTMLGAMLGNVASATTSPESPFKHKLAYRQWPSAGWRSALRSRLAADFRFRIWESPPPDDADLDTHGAGIDGQPPSPQDVGAGILATVAAYARANGRESAFTAWIDHTPANIVHAAALLRLFPQARFIHLVRDPRGICSSILPLDWGPKNAFDAGRWWVRQVACGLALESALPAQTLRVRYEDLLADAPAQLQRICSFTGQTYDPAMAQPQGFKVPSYTRNQHALVGSQLLANHAQEWRRRLTPRQIELVEAATLGIAEHLGYERTIADPRPRGAWATLADRVFDVAWRAPRSKLRMRIRQGRSDRT
jgi:hypothetical protein